MKTCNHKGIVFITVVFSFSLTHAQFYKTNSIHKEYDFTRPQEKKMGSSLTFDDARLSQVDKGIPLPDKYGVKATLIESAKSNGQWIDNVHNMASYVKGKRGEPTLPEVPLYKNPAFPIEQRISDLLSRMTLEEKVGQMNIPTCYSTELGWGLDSDAPYLWDMEDTKEVRDKQLAGCRKWTEGTHNDVMGPGGGFFTLSDRLIYEGPRRQAEIMNELQKIALQKTRLGIPLFQIEEGTHGLMCPGGTIFPEGLAIGASWNKDLIQKIYAVAAKEGKAIGIHGLCTLVIEPNRDPRMGRNEEGYSEDPFMCSQIAGRIVQALQGFDISSSDKLVAFLCHYPGQSQPVSGIERGAMEVSERKLREVFLPSFATGIKKYGALGVMATYPAIDGVAVHSSEKILTKILREELNFNGIVVSEGGGLGTIVTERHAATQKEAGIFAIKAGVDVGISIEDAYMGGLIENVYEGNISMKDVDQAVSRLLRLKFQMGLFEHPCVDPEYAERIVNSKEHRELALQAAREGIVLLKNENKILPLKKDIKRIAVIGPNADAPIDQLGDYFPHHIPQHVVTVIEGIQNKVPAKTNIAYVKGCDVIGNELNEIEKAKNAAKNADIAIVVIGEGGYRTNGEGRDVASLDLTGLQEELLKGVYATGTPTVVVLINGRPLSIRWASEHIPAIIEAWMCGEQGGNAVADVLFGDYNPSGRLPITVPRHSGQFPFYYNHSATKERARYIDMPATPLYEFGFGLSYTTFEYCNLSILPKEINKEGAVEITLDVVNTGTIRGDEVVQLYINDIISSTSRPVKELKGYEKISFEPGEKKTVKFRLLPEDLSLYDRDMNFVVEPGIFQVMVGSSSKDIRLKGEFEVKNHW